jgi:mannitol/fructose-specific phosphotransferase system IIA component (Ntr-type)
MTENIGPELRKLISTGLICVDVSSSGVVDVIQELLEVLVSKQKLTQTQSQKVKLRLLDREEMGSTVLPGKHIAVPHLRIDYVLNTTHIVGIAKNGTLFGADECVYAIFLTLSPTGKYFEALESLYRLLKNYDGNSLIRELSNAGIISGEM